MRTSAFRALWTTAWVLAACLLGSVASAQSSEPVYYYHTDGIGSVRMVTNAQGQVVERHDYQPFGVEVSPPAGSSERVRFAGKEHDPETGASGWMALDYFGARYLHSATGRFASPDPVVDIETALSIPQRWNMYAYVLNNPVRYTDPDGRCVFVVADTLACAAGAGAIITTGVVVKAAVATAIITGAAWLGYATAENSKEDDEGDLDGLIESLKPRPPKVTPERDPIDQLDDIAEAQRNIRAGKGKEIIDSIKGSEQALDKLIREIEKNRDRLRDLD